MSASRLFTVLALLVGGCTAAQPAARGGGADNTLPKYGNPHHRTIWSQPPTDRRAAQSALSADASERGWSLLRQGDAATAMKRFNQAWSMDPRNAAALWGMAIVQYERARQSAGAEPTPQDLARLDEAVSLIDEAAALPSPPASLLSDNALLVATRGGMRRALSVDGSAADFDRAEQLLRRAQAMEVHPLVYENWAALERYRGNAQAAERHAEKARQLRGAPAGG